MEKPERDDQARALLELSKALEGQKVSPEQLSGFIIQVRALCEDLLSADSASPEMTTAIVRGKDNRPISLQLKHKGTAAFIESMGVDTDALSKECVLYLVILYTLVDEFLSTGKAVSTKIIAGRTGYAINTIPLAFSYLRNHGMKPGSRWTIVRQQKGGWYMPIEKDS